MADSYVALWGNDNNTGADWTNAKRSIQGAIDIPSTNVYVKGWHNEKLTASFPTINMMPGAIIDGSNLTVSVGNIIMKNGTYQNWPDIPDGRSWEGVFNKNITAGIVASGFNTIDKEVFWLSNNFQISCKTVNAIKANNTFHGIETNILTLGHIGSNVFNPLVAKDSIISNFKINITAITDYFVYSLYINSQFMFDGGGLGFDEVVYSYPAGANDAARLQDLKDRMVVVYGGIASDYLQGCKYYSGDYNDIFINADKGDFTLVQNSIPANLAYNGSFVGKYGIGYKTEFADNFNSIVNISEVVSTLGYVEDQETDASCTANVIDLGVVKNICQMTNLGDLAARNGQQLNTESDLGAEEDNTTTLIVDDSYLVVNNTITYNSVTYNPWDTFLCVTGFTTFTGTGDVQKIDQVAFDEKIKIQVSKTDSTVSGATILTVFVNEEIQINEDVDGIPTFGNADAGYSGGSAVDLDTRYIKILVNIQANNLPAR